MRAKEYFLLTVENLKKAGDLPSDSTLHGLAKSQFLSGDDTGGAATIAVLCEEHPSRLEVLTDELSDSGNADVAMKVRMIVADHPFIQETYETWKARASALSKLTDRLSELVLARKKVISFPEASEINHAELVYDLLRIGDDTLACETHRAATCRFPNSNLIPMNAGWGHVFRGRGREALGEFDRAATCCSLGDLYAYIPLGQAAAHWLMGEKDKAFAYFAAVLKIDSSFAEAETIIALEWPESETKVVEALRASYVKFHLSRD